jgi:putative zinc finger/helix-turn-helix YgiT family protein
MEEHDVQTVLIRESNVFKGVPVEYDAEYFYCDKADETYADEQQISSNDIAMKNAYRVASGLLTSDQIAAIRARYGISQSDLCLLLGWGAKTITRSGRQKYRKPNDLSDLPELLNILRDIQRAYYQGDLNYYFTSLTSALEEEINYYVLDQTSRPRPILF